MKLFKRHWKVSKERKINDDIQGIINFFIPMEDPSEMEGFNILKYTGIISFQDSSGRTRDELVKRFHLETLNIRSKYNSFTSWQADFDEYVDVYLNKEIVFCKTELSNINKLIKSNEKSIHYSYTLIKYEDTIRTILNTLEESKEINGDVDYLVKKKSMSLLKKFVADVNQCDKELKNSKKRDIEAANKSLLERLENEEKYIKQFVNIT